MIHLKVARVKEIKNNIQKGDQVPFQNKDGDVGQWVDQVLTSRGHIVDPFGVVDLPQYRIDNKTHKKGSTSYYTVGSMTIDSIIKTPNWYDTRYYKKSLNQNQIEWDANFQEVTNVTILDMDLSEIQEPLKAAYDNLRSKVIDEDRRRHISSDCGWAVFDGYNHDNSYRFRITVKAMNKIKNMSKSRDTRKRLFEQVD